MPAMTSICMTSATAATITKTVSKVSCSMVCSHRSHLSQRARGRGVLSLALLFLVSLLPGIESCRQLLFLLSYDVLSLFDQVLGLPAQFSSLGRHIVFAFAGLLGDIFSRFLARPGSEKESSESAQAESGEEESDVRSPFVVTHENLPSILYPSIVNLQSKYERPFKLRRSPRYDLLRDEHRIGPASGSLE